MKNVICTISFYADSSDYGKLFERDFEIYDYIDSVINSMFPDEVEFEKRCIA